MILQIFLTILLSHSSQQLKCISRNFGHGSTVCVCNSSYCDTLIVPQPMQSSEFLVFTSNKAGQRFDLSGGNFTKDITNGGSQIYVDDGISYQTIEGWGGAFTDSAGFNINSLPVECQEMLLKAYFSEEGLEYNLGRVPIGGTDFSLRAYTYDDGAEDPLLVNFRLAPEDLMLKIPHIQKAYSLNNNLRLFGSPWSAPKWMKTNHEYTGTGFIWPHMYQSWANYLLKFVNDYCNHGLEFWAITTGNEPSMALNPGDSLEVVGWSPQTMGKWVKSYLGPTFRNSNYSNIKIMILDDQRILLPWYVQESLTDGEARQYIDGIAVHWYADTISSADVLTRTKEIFPEKFLLYSESSNSGAASLGNWEKGQMYSENIIEVMHNWVSGWVDWNMVLDQKGGPNYIQNYIDAPIIVNSAEGEFYKQPAYYHLGHFSKFVPQGSKKIEAHTAIAGLGVIAFQKPDGGTVVVLLNKNLLSLPINLNVGVRGLAAMVLSPQSITTVLYW